jgi:sulfoxide reductase heme-binding subunit YedZ
VVNLLQYRLLNGWPLFFLIAAVTFAAMVTAYLLIGVDTPEPAVNIIRLSVQLASPWVFLAFVARPMTQLFPGNLSKWLLRNRRYFGLSFAAGFGWQAVFIGVLLALHNAYYWNEWQAMSFSSP